MCNQHPLVQVQSSKKKLYQILT
jgi:hypothetical protein